MHEEKLLFLYHIFCVKLLHTLQFASTLYQRYNFFGDVKITCDLQWTKNSWLPRFDKFGKVKEVFPCQVNVISTSREFPLSVVESKNQEIASGIMNDVFNSYGLWECPLFDDEGKLIESKLR